MRKFDMLDSKPLQHEIGELFSKRLNLEVSSFDMDLVATGALDSLMLVELLFQLEQAYGTVISIENLDIDHFRSIARIAEFVANHNGVESPS
jgi:acyl carrier protein